jgi:hypothetical protein
MGSGRTRYAGAHPLNTGPRHGPAGPRRPRSHGEAGWAEPRFRPKSRIQIRKPFSFSKLFYKLQVNLISNQV